MSENPIRPFRPDPLRSAGPAVVMVQSDTRRLVVILFSVALVLGAGIGILGFLAGRRSEVGKIRPPDFAPFPPVQAAKPPPPPLQIVPLPEGSLVREEPPPTPGSPVVLGVDGAGQTSIEGDGAAFEEKPAIVIRRHEPKRGWVLSTRVPPAPPAAPASVPAAPAPAPPAPSAAPAPTPAEPDPASPPPAALTSAPPPGVDPSLDSSFDSSLEPPPPPP